MLGPFHKLLRRKASVDESRVASSGAPEAPAGPRTTERAEAATLIAQANRLVGAGQFAQAVPVYEQALRLEADNVLACSNLGFALMQIDRLDDAKSWLEKAVAQNPRPEEPYLFLGQIAERQADIPTALRRLGEAVQRKPGFAFAWQELCRLQFHAGDPALARESALRGLQVQPDSAMLNFYLGNVLYHDADFAGAADRFRLALRTAPDLAQAHMNLGRALLRLADPEQALHSLRRALDLDPTLHESHVYQGQALQSLTRLDEAAQAFERALQARPDHVEALYALGELQVMRHRFDQARECFDRAGAIDNDQPRKLLVSANLLRASGRYEAAEAAYRQALELRPDYFDAYNNLGSLLAEMQRFDEAEAAFHDALRQSPDDATARWNLGLMLLRLGQLERGWPLHEARHDPRLAQRVTVAPRLGFPQWHGEPLDGRSIVVLSEQGFGDEIQMARYLPFLKQRGASRVSVVCKRPLAELYRHSAIADEVYAEGDESAPHDFWVLCLSLPLMFDTTLETIPATLPYLTADPRRIAAWAPRLPQGGRRVGLVWKGAAGHGNDLHRSLPDLGALAALWSCPGLHFVSLQKGQGEDEAERFAAAQPITAVGPAIENFADTAAILASLDLLICVDTSTAHLAGALGRPCWVLLPDVNTDWRWLLEREDSPWYPGALRLFRKAPGEAWEGTVQRVAAALREWSTS